MKTLALLIIMDVLWMHPILSQAEDESGLSRPVGPGEIPTPAVPVKRVNPQYPSQALIDYKDGWVMVSYTISTEGKVIEAMIEDSSGNEDLERATLKVLRKWEFKPALLNGKPVEQSMTRTRMVFQLEPGVKGASNKFIRRFKAINKLIKEGKLDEAEPLLVDLELTEKHNLYEDAWFWWLHYEYLKAGGKAANSEMRDSLSKAIGYEEDYLQPDVFVAASQSLYKLEIQDRDFSAAIDTYERLANSKEARRSNYYKEVITNLQTHVQKVRELIAGNEILSLDARIGEHDYWSHRLLRRSFSLSDISGVLELVDIRCERRTARYTVSDTSTWTIPESWGNCNLYIKGTPGSTFRIYEYPR